MPATTDELFRWLDALLDGTVMPDTVPVWADGTTATDEEQRSLDNLLRHEAQRRAHRRRIAQSVGPRRKAYRLLRGFLTGEQVQQLRRRGEFHVTTGSGRHYRLVPRTATVHRVELHGSRYFVRQTFCLHPDNPEDLPPADITLAQFLLLSADEPEFLLEANAWERRSQLWDGAWLRQRAQARRERAAT